MAFEKLYANPPKMMKDEKGGSFVKKHKPEMTEKEKEKGEHGKIPHHIKHAMERNAMHSRHELEHTIADHNKEDKKPLHEKHRKEMAEMHKRHEEEMKHKAKGE